MHSEPQTPTAVAPSARSTGSAAITTVVPTSSGLTVAASGSYKHGIGRVDFVLVDLTSDVPAAILDRKDVEYARAPKQVAEAWESAVALSADRPYRLFVHVYDRTGVNLVAYDRRDFTCEAKGA